MKLKTFLKIFVVMQLTVLASNVNAGTSLNANDMNGLSEADVQVILLEIASACQVPYVTNATNTYIDCVYLQTCIDEGNRAVIRLASVNQEQFGKTVEADADVADLRKQATQNLAAQESMVKYTSVITKIKDKQCNINTKVH